MIESSDIWLLAGGAVVAASVPILHRVAGWMLAGMDTDWASSARDWAALAGAGPKILSALEPLSLPAPQPLTPRHQACVGVAAASASSVALWNVTGFAAAAVLALALGLTLASICDLRGRLIPDALILPLAALGLVLATLGYSVPVEASAIGLVAGWGSLWLLSVLYTLVTRRHGLGLGDAKLLGLAGAWAGWQLLPSIALVAVLLAIMAAILIAKGRPSTKMAVPLGPSLAFATLLALGTLGRLPGGLL